MTTKPPITVTSFAVEYLLNYAEVNLRQSSYDRVLFGLQPILKTFGRRTLQSLTQRDIEEYQTLRTLFVKPLTVNHEIAIFHHLLNKAIDWGYLLINPATRIKALKVQPFRERALTFEERERLLDECMENHVLYAIVLTALETGMRRGEIRGLMWKDIDFKHYRITLLYTKNNEVRYVPISNRLHPILEVLSGCKQGEYVFSKPDGRPYGDWRKSFASACRRAGITDLRFHDLRHTFASWLSEMGADPRTIMEICGWKDPKMMCRYSHVSHQHKLDVVNGMGIKQQTDLPQNLAPVAQGIERWFPKPVRFSSSDEFLEINYITQSTEGQGIAEGHRLGGRNAVNEREEERGRVGATACDSASA